MAKERTFKQEVEHFLEVVEVEIAKKSDKRKRSNQNEVAAYKSEITLFPVVSDYYSSKRIAM